MWLSRNLRSILLVCLALALAGCSQQPKATPLPTAPTAKLQGTILVSGAWALYPMMVKWSEEFQALHPQVRIDVSAGGAGKGVSDALSGMVDLGMVSRDIKPEEVQQGGVYVPVVKDAVFPAVNVNNPALSSLLAKGMSKQNFIDLWITGKSLTWGDITGTDNKDLVQVYTRSDSCGAADTWAKYMGKAQEDLKGTAVYGDPGLAEAIQNDKLGIGYNNLNYAYDLKTGQPVAGLAIVPIDVNDNGKVDPEEELKTKAQALQAISDKVYPSPPARDLFLITKDSFKGLTKVFVEWILTDGQKYLNEAGYIPLDQSQIDAALETLASSEQK